MRGSASGFCVYNDPAIAIAWLLGQGAERVAYVDVDVHHGDGVQAAFYDDPRVLTISLHQHPAALWPGTGTRAYRRPHLDEVGASTMASSQVERLSEARTYGLDGRRWFRCRFMRCRESRGCLRRRG